MKKIIFFLFFMLTLCQPIYAYETDESINMSEDVPADMIYYFELAGNAFDICPEVLEAIAYHESRFFPESKNGHCYGIMQINVNVHKKRIQKYGWTEKDMLDPLKNIIVAADLLEELYEKYEDSGAVLAIYSGNFSAAKEYEKSGVLCNYANVILDKSYELEELHRKHEVKDGK